MSKMMQFYRRVQLTHFMLQCNIYRMATAMRELLEHRLPAGRSLASYVTTCRRQGLGWRRIADQVHTDTGVAVSHATLRRWFPEKKQPPAA